MLMSKTPISSPESPLLFYLSPLSDIQPPSPTYTPPLRENKSALVPHAHGFRFHAHGFRFHAHGFRFHAHGFRFHAHGFRFHAHGSYSLRQGLSLREDEKTPLLWGVVTLFLGGGEVGRGFLLPVYNVIIYGHHVCRVDIAIVIDVRSFAVEAGCTAIRDETVHCGYIGSVDIAIVIQILFRKFHDILEFFPAIKPLNFFFAAVEDIKCSCVVNIFLETVIVNTKRILGQILDGCQSRAFIESPFSYARHGVRDGY